jgi:Flp pilus assembly protein TadD
MSRRWVAALPLLALAALTFAAFSPLLSAGFINYDDNDYVTGNPQVRAGLTLDGLFWAFTTFHASNWHPLTWLSHMLDVQLYGMRPWGHHLTSLLLHLASAILLFLFLKAATSAPVKAFLVAALFALHPLHVESVAWISERKDLLAGLCFLLTLIAWRRYALRPGPLRYLAAATPFALGLLAKPMLVTLPFLLLLLDLWPLRRLDTNASHRFTTAARLLAEKLPLLALSALSAAVTLRAQRESITDLWALPFPDRLENALVSLFTYVGRTFWPVDLAIFYPHPGGGRPLLLVILAAAGLLALTLLTIATLRRAPFLAVGWWWFAGMLVPVSGLVQVGSQASADRYTYLPSIGLFIALVWGFDLLADLLLPDTRRRALLPLFAALLIPLPLLTYRQASVWHDTTSLFAHAVKATGGSALAHHVLGLEHRNAGNLEEAVAEFRAAYLLDPINLDVNYSLALTLHRLGKAAEAEPHLRFLLAARPSGPKWSNNIGVILALTGDLPGAIASFREAVWQHPGRAGARANLANALRNAGETEEAIAEYREAIRIDPLGSGAIKGLGLLLADRGASAEAEELLRRAAALDPSDLEARFALAILLAGRGEDGEAISLLTLILARDPLSAAAHNNLGVLLARAGRTAEAREQFARALAIDPDLRDSRENLARIDGETTR